jgi:hypothetical protein
MPLMTTTPILVVFMIPHPSLVFGFHLSKSSKRPNYLRRLLGVSISGSALGLILHPAGLEPATL